MVPLTMRTYAPGRGALPHILLSALFAISAFALPRTGLADPPPQTATSTASAEAAQHTEIARNLYKDGKYLEALEAFRKAYGLTPTAALTYNIARCHERLSQWQEALAMYERYAKEATDPRDRAEALEKIDALKKRIGADANTPEGRYEARIAAGKQAYGRGDYEGAIEAFKAAFDAKPVAGALFNIAKSYEKMTRYEEAIDFYQQYIDLDPKAPDRGDVEETINRLKKTIRERYQELSVSSDPPGADIYLDDRNTGLQGQTNYRFKVTPGPHTLYLDLNGYEPTKRDFIMPDDKPLALDFKLKKLENVGYLEIKVDQDGARIFVDGAIVGLSPYKVKKALPEGEHQVQVEQPGYLRWSQSVNVAREETTAVEVILQKPAAGLEDETLSKWGRDLLLIGLIGGTLGVVGPYGYQKLILRRDPFSQLGPKDITEGTWRGPLKSGAPGYREDPTHKALYRIQFWSVVGGSTLVAGGLAFYCWKWFRPTPQKPVVAGGDGLEVPPEVPGLAITGLGLSPDGLGLTGTF